MPTINGTSGDDTLNGTSGQDEIYGLEGNDTINAGDGDDTLSGGDGNDTLNGNGDNDTLNGDAGADHLRGGAGDDVLNGGANGDRAWYDDALAGVTVNLATGVATSTVGTSAGIGTDQLTGIESVTGGNFNDTITGDGGGNILRGGAGDDWIDGGDSDDWLIGDDGNDQLYGSAGEDVLDALAGNDSLYGGADHDELYGNEGDDFLDGGADWDIMFGGQGNDIYVFDYDFGGVSDYISEQGGDGTDEVRASLTYTLGFDLENLILTGTAAINGTGNQLANVISGNDAANQLSGLAGNDTLNGGGGNDILDGGIGADALSGGVGDDIYIVDSESDTVDESGGGGVDTVRSTASFYSLTDGVENLELQGSGHINGSANDLDNLITGNSGNNSLIGLGGNDTINGAEGDDRLSGGAGNDVLNGGSGTDTASYSGDGPSGVTVNLSIVGAQTISAVSGMDTLVDIENLLGSSGADNLTGNAGSNVLTGQLGADNLTGGGGDDTFNDTAAGLNGDTISDLAIGDKIVISNANLAGFTFSLSGSTLTYTGGTLTLTGFAGQLQASAAAGGGVQLIAVQPAVPDALNDFNGDGRSDVLWRNNDGTFGNWLGNANGMVAYNDVAGLTSIPTDWRIAGTGDFNGDGRDDILWRHNDGTFGNWLANAQGGFAYNPAAGLTKVPTDWRIVGTGDFNGDGKDDILWRNNDGSFGNWLADANGAFAYNPAAGLTKVPTDWHIVGPGDFNGDGRSDILWRNNDGTFGNWLADANGAFAYNSAAGLTKIPTDWHIAGTGDFNGDGKDDILWRNNDGTFGNWLADANGAFAYNPAAGLTPMSDAWDVADIGDYNGDGRDDILWRNDSGAMADWLANANGSFSSSNAFALSPVPTSWQVQSPDIFWL